MRCSKCLLPSSLPNSHFNENNECIWCQTNYPNYTPKGEDKLIEILEQHRSITGSADCLVGLSGGKDSTYTLYKLKKHFGMNVEAFTYFFDGMSPLSLESAKKVCKKLDVKHHVVSLTKREHLRIFQDFFKAWMKHPTTVSAGMTCVACKHMHILANKVAIERNIPMTVWAPCPIEAPVFIAVPIVAKDKDLVVRQGMMKSISLLGKEVINSAEFGKQLIRHLNTSFLGCLSLSPSSKFLTLRYPSVKPIFFFEYVKWNPPLMIKTITEELGWESPVKNVDDWHSDCIFHIIKEYMFQKMLGISYIDDFLSNQIRNNIITREEAIESLLKKKVYLKNNLLKALEVAELKDYADKIDLTCFDITTN